jgi:hypothetical protein
MIRSGVGQATTGEVCRSVDFFETKPVMAVAFGVIGAASELQSVVVIAMGTPCELISASQPSATNQNLKDIANIIGPGLYIRGRAW